MLALTFKWNFNELWVNLLFPDGVVAARCLGQGRFSVQRPTLRPFSSIQLTAMTHFSIKTLTNLRLEPRSFWPCVNKYFCDQPKSSFFSSWSIYSNELNYFKEFSTPWWIILLSARQKKIRTLDIVEFVASDVQSFVLTLERCNKQSFVCFVAPFSH